MTEPEFDKLFKIPYKLIQFHRTLLKNLYNIKLNEDLEIFDHLNDISQCFLVFRAKFDLYLEFSMNFNNQECLINNYWDYFKNISNLTEAEFNFPTLINQPSLRPSQYTFIFQQFLECLDPSTSNRIVLNSYNLLTKVFQMMRSLSGKMNQLSSKNIQYHESPHLSQLKEQVYYMDYLTVLNLGERSITYKVVITPTKLLFVRKLKNRVGLLKKRNSIRFSRDFNRSFQSSSGSDPFEKHQINISELIQINNLQYTNQPILEILWMNSKLKVVRLTSNLEGSLKIFQDILSRIVDFNKRKQTLDNSTSMMSNQSKRLSRFVLMKQRIKENRLSKLGFTPSPLSKIMEVDAIDESSSEESTVNSSPMTNFSELYTPKSQFQQLSEYSSMDNISQLSVDYSFNFHRDLFLNCKVHLSNTEYLVKKLRYPSSLHEIIRWVKLTLKDHKVFQHRLDSIKLKYLDEDGDLINIKLEAELQEFILEVTEYQIGLLRNHNYNSIQIQLWLSA